MQTSIEQPRRSHADVINETANILREARRAIEVSGYVELQHIEVEVHERHVFLRGSVSSYFHKQVAQELIKHTPGVTSLQNEILVASKGK